jgi:hypothetical protein
MKAQSPDSRFRKTPNYSLAAFFDCQTLELDPIDPNNEDPVSRARGPGV